MDAQLAVVIILIAGATLFWARQAWRSLYARSGCGTSCGGCGPATKQPTLISASDLSIRLRQR